MSNYSIMNNNSILENSTNQVVFTSEDESELYKKLSWLNMGGAFDGWTPEFILKKVEINFDDDELDGE